VSDCDKNDRLLVTGASGFIGRGLISAISGYKITGCVRIYQNIDGCDSVVEIGDIQDFAGWNEILHGIDCVVHLAAVAHNNAVESSKNEIYNKINVDSTMVLAESAADAGVRRFVYISTIGVNGDVTYQVPFTENDIPHPYSIYATSKFQAENQLFDLGRTSGMEITVIRPPLVYGADAPGNFGTLIKFLNLRIPLPLGAVHNRRSFVCIDNLVSFIKLCTSHPNAANEVFVVCDDDDISTTDLLRHLGRYLNKPAWLVPVPSSILVFFARIFGKERISRQLLENLQVDNSKAKRLLGWSPPVSLELGLKKTAEWYFHHQ